MIMDALHTGRNEAIEQLKVILSADEGLGIAKLVDKRRSSLLGHDVPFRTGRAPPSLGAHNAAPNALGTSDLPC